MTRCRNREKSRDRWARLKGALGVLLQQEKIQDGETVLDVSGQELFTVAGMQW